MSKISKKNLAIQCTVNKRLINLKFTDTKITLARLRMTPNLLEMILSVLIPTYRQKKEE